MAWALGMQARKDSWWGDKVIIRLQDSIGNLRSEYQHDPKTVPITSTDPPNRGV
jgi:hypothetical protein